MHGIKEEGKMTTLFELVFGIVSVIYAFPLECIFPNIFCFFIPVSVYILCVSLRERTYPSYH